MCGALLQPDLKVQGESNYLIERQLRTIIHLSSNFRVSCYKVGVNILLGMVWIECIWIVG